MRNLNKFFFALAIPLLLAASSHKFYLSLFQFKYASDEKSVHCTAKVFTDDLELALKKNGMSVTLGKQIPDSVGSAIHAYFSKHIELNTGKGNQKWKWIGYEQENEVCFIYLESALDSLPNKANLKVDFLQEIYEDQINLTHFEAFGKRQSFNLSKSKPAVQLSFQR